MKLFLIGYFGFGNIGDDLILGNMLAFLNRYYPQATIYILGEQKGLKFNYAATYIQRHKWLQIMQIIRTADVVLFPGGGLWQDKTGRGLSPLYYGFIAKLALMFSKPVILFNQEIEFFKRPLWQVFVKRICEQAMYVSLRDTTPAFLLEQTYKRFDVFPDSLCVIEQPEQSRSPVRIGICVSHTLTRDMKKNIIKALEQMPIKQITLFNFFPLQDNAVMVAMAKKLEPLCPVEHVTGALMLKKIGSCSLFIGMRYHSLVLAANYGIPFLGIASSAKVERLCDKYNQPCIASGEKECDHVIHDFMLHPPSISADIRAESAGQVIQSYMRLKKALDSICTSMA